MRVQGGGWSSVPHPDPELVSTERDGLDPSVRVSIVSWNEASTDCLAVRREVFGGEQAVPEEIDVDGRDPDCVHVLAVDGRGEPVGTGRLLPDGRLGRMAVRRAWRRKGIARRMLETLENEAIRMGIEKSVLHAQVGARGFYEAMGYRPAGPLFWEVGIPHQTMAKHLTARHERGPRRS